MTLSIFLGESVQKEVSTANLEIQLYKIFCESACLNVSFWVDLGVTASS